MGKRKHKNTEENIRRKIRRLERKLRDNTESRHDRYYKPYYEVPEKKCTGKLPRTSSSAERSEVDSTSSWTAAAIDFNEEDHDAAQRTTGFVQQAPRQETQIEIDGATGEQESFGSVLQRSVKLARALRSAGLEPGDVVVLAGYNHIHVNIPFYAAIFNGLTLCGIDPPASYEEVKDRLETTKPKLAFIENEKHEIYSKAANELGLDLKLITFTTGDMTMTHFIEIYDDGSSIQDFKPNEVDISNNYLWLFPTSGSTGPPKLLAFKQQPVYDALFSTDRSSGLLDCESVPFLCLSPVTWSTGSIMTIMQPFSNIIVLTCGQDDVNCLINVINKYRPNYALIPPPILNVILKHQLKCDLTCFKILITTGCSMSEDIYKKIKNRACPDTLITEIYGMTETIGTIFSNDYTIANSPDRCCYSPDPYVQVKLVDTESGAEINEPGKPGELLYKGPMFSCYYKNPDLTKRAFTSDDWFKTGDLFYKDGNGFFIFVDKINFLFISLFNNNIFEFSPTELEKVIETHPGILEVCVSYISHDTYDQWPVACVVRKPGYNVTAQEIKQLVAEKLHEAKQLRGGVVFLDALPKTTSGKLARHEMKKIVMRARRE